VQQVLFAYWFTEGQLATREEHVYIISDCVCNLMTWQYVEREG
jgi:hypothetical protein